MKRRLRTKVSLGFLAIIACCMLVLLVCSETLLRPLFLWNSKAKMRDASAQIEQILSTDPDETEELLEELYDGYLIRGTVISEDGLYEYTTETDERQKTGLKVGKYYRQLIAAYGGASEGLSFFEWKSSENGLRRLYGVKQLSDGRYLVLNKGIRGIEQDVELVNTFLLAACVLIALFGVLMWSVVSRPLIRRLEEVCETTREMANLDFSKRLPVTGSDEIAQLARSVNELSSDLEHSIQDMQAELERRKELMRNLSHEIKTPLTTIRGYTENMQVLAAKDPRMTRYCGIMLEECDALNLLAREMLEVSALEGQEQFYQREDLETAPLFERLMRRVERKLPENRVETECENAVVLLNEHLFERVVQNYLVNAVKYGSAEAPIQLRGVVRDGWFSTEVTNVGAPISEEDQKRIWDPFYKGDKARTRSNSYGIGLYIVRQIAESYGGRVGVRCGDGRTTFYFQLPVVTDC